MKPTSRRHWCVCCWTTSTFSNDNPFTCKECTDIIAKYSPKKKLVKVDADGEVTLYESSLGYNPFKE